MTKIVFIEDEPALQKTLGDFLREQGFAVISALDGEQGLAAVSREHPALVLLDLVLPRMHGLDVLASLQNNPALAAIPVIVLTNVESNESVERAIALGAKAYLVKTNYTLQEMLEKVKNVLEHHGKKRD